MASSITSLDQSANTSRTQRLRNITRILRENPLLLVGILVIIFWLVIIIIAPSIAPYEPLQQNIVDRLTPPNDQYLMGTDELGRDIFSRVLYGARITIPASLSVIIVGSLVGTFVGAIAGYLGGIWDEILMRLTELFFAFPTIILALAVTAALGPDIRNAILALVIVWWPTYARLIRGMVLEIKNEEYVDATRAVGARGSYILFRTILPNAIAPTLVVATLDIGNATLTFAGLSFLGLGAEPSSPEWGRMVAIGIDFFDQWWMWLFPGLAIASIVMAFNFIGDGIRDVADPRTSKQH